MDVAVLVGGCSPEHDISLASASQVLTHLDRERWRVWPVLLERDGGWRPRAAPLRPGDRWLASDRDALRPTMRPGAALDWLLDHAGVGLVFPVLHGPFGEDGTVQGMLELTGVPFVGSGCAASAVAMDKLRTREVFAAAGVPIATAYVPGLVSAPADPAAHFAAMREAVGTPAFAKIDVSGSTVGVHRITCEDDLAAFLREHGDHCRRWLVEQGVRGEEITVPVLGNSGAELEALPPVGIYPVDDEWFTHDAKYRPGATEEVVPPRGLSAAGVEQVQRLALRCHELLVCDGMSRTDMIITADGPVVLETNTIPGLTSTSLLPRAAAAAGLDFPRLLDRLLELGLEHHRGHRRAVATPRDQAEGAATAQHGQG
ncbi:MAG: D-alanine--D-alanine ligase [Planctomycetes bacterium]|nr:D-alanine--D-alanine ligase [Planctomycetota bacterium]